MKLRAAEYTGRCMQCSLHLAQEVLEVNEPSEDWSVKSREENERISMNDSETEMSHKSIDNEIPYLD